MIRKILFVCTGNACRSPMAEVLARYMIGKDPVLCCAGIEVDSAGTDVGVYPAAPDAVRIMSELGLDLSTFVPKQVDGGLMEWADLVLTMQEEHRELIASEFPEARRKTFLLAGYAGENGDIPDPIHRGTQAYRDCAASIQALLDKIIRKLAE